MSDEILIILNCQTIEIHIIYLCHMQNNMMVVFTY